MDAKFPVTTNTEYKDVSLLLSSLTHGITVRTPFYVVALSAFGLLYSSIPDETRPLIEDLRLRVLGVNGQSELIAESVEALGFAAHVLIKSGKWGQEMRDHERDLRSYLEKVAELEWLRSPTIAASFLMGFATLASFQPLISGARAYLERQLHEATDSNLPIIAFGLYRGGCTPEIDDAAVRAWLDRKHQPFKQLCLLAVTLDALGHPLSQQAITCLQAKSSGTYTTMVGSNMSTIRALLAIVHMAEMGQSGSQIEDALNRLTIDEAVRNRVSAVIRADSQLLIEFRNDLLAQSPTIEYLVFYLFAASELGLDKAYIINDTLEKPFSEFLRVWQNRHVHAVHRTPLLIVIIIALGASILALYRMWWPLSNSIYNQLMKTVSSQLVGSYLDDFLKYLIALPLYFIFGSALALWARGDVQWSDVGPEGIVANIRAIISKQ